jgi:hypothetical protein
MRRAMPFAGLCAVVHVGCRGVVGIVVGWRHIYLTPRAASTVDTLIWRRDRSSIILNIDKKDCPFGKCGDTSFFPKPACTAS